MATRDTEQLQMAVLEIATCIAQALHETDASATQRMNFAAGMAYNRLKSRGDDAAAEMLYQFGRALLNHDLFPETGSKPEDEQ
jgi:hypothetical protein